MVSAVYKTVLWVRRSFISLVQYVLLTWYRSALGSVRIVIQPSFPVSYLAYRVIHSHNDLDIRLRYPYHLHTEGESES